jgi:8-oxo-dGTP diphosphatase
MTNAALRPRVGVGVLIVKDGTVLLMKRKGSHGNGTWAPPGGKLDFGEEIETCATRETFEETGLKIKNPRFLTITNDISLEENNHYVTLWMIARYNRGQPENIEPEKCEALEWFDLNDLPSPLFLPMINLLKAKVKILP